MIRLNFNTLTPTYTEMQKETEIKARAFDRLIEHLNNRKDVQNIDLMILANFCRNCLSRWMSEEAELLGETLDTESAREIVYKMPYSQWKKDHQTPASDEKLLMLKNSKK